MASVLGNNAQQPSTTTGLQTTTMAPPYYGATMNAQPQNNNTSALYALLGLVVVLMVLGFAYVVYKALVDTKTTTTTTSADPTKISGPETPLLVQPSPPPATQPPPPPPATQPPPPATQPPPPPATIQPPAVVQELAYMLPLRAAAASPSTTDPYVRLPGYTVFDRSLQSTAGELRKAVPWNAEGTETACKAACEALGPTECKAFSQHIDTGRCFMFRDFPSNRIAQDRTYNTLVRRGYIPPTDPAPAPPPPSGAPYQSVGRKQLGNWDYFLAFTTQGTRAQCEAVCDSTPTCVGLYRPGDARDDDATVPCGYVRDIQNQRAVGFADGNKQFFFKPSYTLPP